MTALKEDQEFVHVVQKMAPQSKLLRAWELKGGVSAPFCDQFLELPNGPSGQLASKPCEKETAGSSPKHWKSSPFNERGRASTLR